MANRSRKQQQDGGINMSHDEYWDQFITGSFVPTGGDTFTEHLAEAQETRMDGRQLEGSHSTSLRDLTDQARAANALSLDAVAGTRVSFTSNVGSLLTYDNVPEPHVLGTIVAVRTADGDTTHFNGRVFVSWDDGEFRTMHPEHLRLAPSTMKTASNFRIVTSNLGDISQFFDKTSEEDLVHKATQDLWSFQKDGEDFVLERLFDDTGTPLKV